MLKFILYVVIGIVALFLASCIHIFKALRMGYSIETIRSVLDLDSVYERTNIARIILGLLIWPIRLIQFIMAQEDYFMLYEEAESK